MAICPRRRRTHIAGGIRRCARIGAQFWPRSRSSLWAPGYLWWAPLPLPIHTIHRRVLYFLLLDSFALYRAPIMSSIYGWRPKAIEGLTFTTYLCLHKHTHNIYIYLYKYTYIFYVNVCRIGWSNLYQQYAPGPLPSVYIHIFIYTIIFYIW